MPAAASSAHRSVFRAAYKGKNVTFWLRSEGSIGRTQPKLDRLKGIYLNTLEAHKALCGTDTQRYSHGLVDGVKDLTPEKIDELKKQVERAYDSIRSSSTWERQSLTRTLSSSP